MPLLTEFKDRQPVFERIRKPTAIGFVDTVVLHYYTPLGRWRYAEAAFMQHIGANLDQLKAMLISRMEEDIANEPKECAEILKLQEEVCTF